MNQCTSDARAADPTASLQAELAARIATFVGSAENRATGIPGLTLHRRTMATAPCSMTYQPSVTVMAQGRKRVDLGSTSFTYGPSQFLLTAVDLPVVSRIVEASEDTPCLAMSLKIEMPVVRELLSREEIHVTEAPSDRPAMSAGRAGVEFLDACCRLLRLLDAPQDAPFLGGLVQREIIYRLLRSDEGARLRSIATLGEQSHRTAKAIAWITANYAKALRVEHLAEIAGMGVSTLHHHFRVLTSMSPLQYQKQVRLQAARARMLTDDLDAATAAFEVGYESASQFNREYSRFFGQPPMRDIKGLRSAGAPQLESVGTPQSAM
ncbi:MAG TPA: AraC family transcriptional regulator [Verrucomicrobiae bacterium]|nr:AraC family transcriptional regulator [Verrucomicrobiae bacterium]